MFGIVLTSYFFGFAARVVDTLIANNDVKEIASLYNVSKDVRYMVVQRLKRIPVHHVFWKYFFNLVSDIKHLIDIDFINIFRDRIEFALDRFVDDYDIREVMLLYRINREIVADRLNMLPDQHRFWFLILLDLAVPPDFVIDDDFVNEFRIKIFP